MLMLPLRVMPVVPTEFLGNMALWGMPCPVSLLLMGLRIIPGQGVRPLRMRGVAKWFPAEVEFSRLSWSLVN